MPKKQVYQVKRYHDISCGHRVVGHEGKCRHLHGHNYRVHFVCEAEIKTAHPAETKPLRPYQLDAVGRVIDFGEVKAKLCEWVETNWDHKFLAWIEDPVIFKMSTIYTKEEKGFNDCTDAEESFVFVPFNPTAENMAEYLVNVIGPQQLKGTGIKLVSVTIDETRKCSVTYGS